MLSAELRAEVAKLNREERLDVNAFLHLLDDPKYVAELDRRVERMERGEVVTAEDLEAAHQHLLVEGR